VLDGGKLAVLRSDQHGHPVLPEPQSFAPQWNSLVFFEVSRMSFHQVEQVYSQNLPRYSITCWFHDPDDDACPVPRGHPLGRNPQPFGPRAFPIKFRCPFPWESLVADCDNPALLAAPVHREHFHGQFLALSRYAGDREPLWMSQLLQDAFHRRLEGLCGCFLDWPTRPVAFVLAQPEHFLRTKRDGDTGDEVFVSLVLRRQRTSGNLLTPHIKLHTKPVAIRQLPEKYSRLVVVTMKFDRKPHNHRA
jgi:hypothetical protein